MRIEIDRLGEANDELVALGGRIQDLAPVFDEIEANLLAHVESTIESQGADVGVHWSPDPGTLRARARGWGYYGAVPGAGGTALRWSGEFEASFRTQARSATEMSFGTRDRRANVLLRSRPILELPDPVEEELIVEPFRRHLAHDE